MEEILELKGLIKQQDYQICTTTRSEVITTVISKAIAFERHNILKLFLGLHLAGIITGTALSAMNQGDLTKGAGIGFGISSINFGVSLVLRAK